MAGQLSSPPPSLSGRLATVAVYAVFAASVTVFVLFFARETSMIVSWSSSGFVLSSLEFRQDNLARMWRADPADYPNTLRPAHGDTLLTIDGAPATFDRWVKLLETPHPPGRQLELSWLEGGDTLRGVIRSRPVQRAHFISVVLAQLLKGLLILSFAGVALWALLLRGSSPAVRVFVLYALSVASFMGVSYMPMFPDMATFHVPGYELLRMLLVRFTFFFSGLWLCLNLLFPRPRGILGRRPALGLLAALSPQLLVLAAATLWLPDGPGAVDGIVPLVIWSSQVAAGLVLLAYTRHRARTRIERRQTTLVLWGSGAGLVLLLLFQAASLGIAGNLTRMPLLARMMIGNVVFLVLLLSPVTFAYAFRRYRLLEVHGALRRGVRNLLVTGGLLAGLGGAILLADLLLSRALGLDGRTPTLLVTLALALSFSPLHRRVRHRVENTVYPARQSLLALLDSFSEWSGTLPGPGPLCDRVTGELRRGLGVRSVGCHLLDGSVAISVSDGAASGPPAATMPWTALAGLLRDRAHPVFVDEIRATSPEALPDAGWAALNRAGVELLLPVRSPDRLLGVLCFGGKLNRDDYHPEEIRILRQLADRTGLALDHQRLLSENLDKQRMEHDLLFARDVQMRMLPLTLPATPGLAIASRVRFCHEVAGDYYDVLPLSDGRTAVAVADVAGKGVGAALLMANLQASFRAFCSIGLDLSPMTRAINRMIHANTAPEAYITFFACVLDPARGRADYVNAGHLPPLLLRPGEPPCELDGGGLVLGVLPDAAYEPGSVDLAPGDRLLIYTDGLSEAINDREEEFGDARVAAAARDRAGLPLDLALEALLEDVRRFTGSAALTDDTTVLLLEVTANPATPAGNGEPASEAAVSSASSVISPRTAG